MYVYSVMWCMYPCADFHSSALFVFSRVSLRHYKKAYSTIQPQSHIQNNIDFVSFTQKSRERSLCQFLCVANSTHTVSLFVSVIRQQFYILYQGFWRFDLFTVVFLLIAILLSNLYALYSRLRFKHFQFMYIYKHINYVQHWICTPLVWRPRLINAE